MTVIAGLGFTTPWLLLGLLALPLIWVLLRAVPPAPKRQFFPAVTLLLGLRDRDNQSDRTPWWLLLLRMLALAAIIIGFAGPVLNPNQQTRRSTPLLLMLDASWAGAENWQATQEQIETHLTLAAQNNRPVAVLRLSDPKEIQFQAASSWLQKLPDLKPRPWQPNPDQITKTLSALATSPDKFDTRWFSDGLEFEGQQALSTALAARGSVSVAASGLPVFALQSVAPNDGAMEITLLRSLALPPDTVVVQARGLDPNGTSRALAQLDANFAPDNLETTLRLSLPAELRARIDRFEIAGHRSAGAVVLSDDSLRRREVALVASETQNEGLALLSALHYLRGALSPTTDLLEGPLATILPANPDVIILADVAKIPAEIEADLTSWIEAGGLLLRFAGPRLAASDTARSSEEPLMPVRLRIGGRSIGGAMSWGAPKTLAPFGEGSPFYGLNIPSEVSVSSQVMAQPDPSLATRVIAALEDGTPLVTRKELGQGQVVLFHITANAEWSNLPLSGLFVRMLERLAISSAAKQPDASSLEGTKWQPVSVLDGFGRSIETTTLPSVSGPHLITAAVSPALQPGLYRHQARRLARNVLRPGETLKQATWGPEVTQVGYGKTLALPLAGPFLGLALFLLALDVAATLFVSGQLRLARPIAILAAFGFAASLMLPARLSAQTTALEHIDRAAELTLAHILTGDATVDRVALAGLQGLSNTLYFRTSVEPSNPASLNLEQDDLALYPLLYWPVTARQPLPSSKAYARLNAYLGSGGMILFDTRDADLSASGATSPAAQRLQQLALPLDIPPLEPIPNDHVLTRAFYLLQDFPGRHPRGALWVEAAPANAEQLEGIPFRDLNDGVTPVVIGGNDWASAWAVDDNGRALLPVGRGYSGERQRELAYRFGVNLVMHVLTGNYKSDQVHIPALLERLGQ